MKTTSPAASRLSVLSLRVEVVDTRPADRPVVTILVDGASPFEVVAPGWFGFDPDDLLGADTPLLPSDGGRRTALYTCSCGIGGCGVIAPFVVPSPDGRRVSWVDFRDYVGVFDRPVAHDSDAHDGRTWDLPDLHFDRRQYEAEVERATADRSWETPRRTVSRLVRAQLEQTPDVLPPALCVRFVGPARTSENGVVVALAFRGPDGAARTDGPFVELASRHQDPGGAADDIVDQLARIPPDELLCLFGERR